MCSCKGGLHLLYVIRLCGGFKPSVSFQDCLGIPGAKRESGKYATYGWTGTRRKKQRSTEKRIHNPDRTACGLHKSLRHNTLFLTLDFFIIYLVLHTLPHTMSLSTVHQMLCLGALTSLRACQYRILWAHCCTLHCIQPQNSR